ncbi:MAG: hypothetical protein KGL38_13240, partial [Gemmatimonadota bacterium]|nr:hypothetical protein [Gemmatimonadota bacterium]
MPQQEPQRQSAPRTITPFSSPAVPDTGRLRFPLVGVPLEALVRSALEEDGAYNDITTIATVVSERRARALLAARQRTVLAGVPLAVE